MKRVLTKFSVMFLFTLILVAQTQAQIEIGPAKKEAAPFEKAVPTKNLTAAPARTTASNASAEAPAFCGTDRSSGNELACIQSRPAYCATESATGNTLACANSKPAYCGFEGRFATNAACVGAKPSYCQIRLDLSNALACIGSQPTHCLADRKFVNDLACAKMNPSYCQSEREMADNLICLGSKPAFCQTDRNLASSLACRDADSVYILDVLKTGKYPVPESFKNLFEAKDLRSQLLYQKLRDTLGTF